MSDAIVWLGIVSMVLVVTLIAVRSVQASMRREKALRNAPYDEIGE